MRAVITGATGAVGMALLNKLTACGVQTLVLCHPGSLRNTNIQENDLVKKVDCALDQLKDYQPTEQYDVFFHFAWEGTARNVRNNLYLQNHNVAYTLDAVRLAQRFGCHTFIGAGSQAEYGAPNKPLNSKVAAHPTSGYGIAKLCAGQMSRLLAHDIGIRHIWTRILSIYGPYDSERMMLMATIRKLQRGVMPEYTPCEQMWDYLYSEDAAEAFYAIAQKGKNEAIYCLGSGSVRRLSDYIVYIRDRVAPEAELGIGKLPYSKNQVMYLRADMKELETDTGFVPKISFEEGIAKTIAWAEFTKNIVG